MNLICMSFDGDYITEARDVLSVDAAWEHAENMGPRWFFYPFHFVLTGSGKSIKAAAYGLEQFVGRRLDKVVAEFKDAAEEMTKETVDQEQFIYYLKRTGTNHGIT